MSELAIYGKVHDLLLWLIPRLVDFPRNQRFVLAKALQDTALTLYDELIAARKSPAMRRGEVLLRADIELDKLRLLLRLSFELRLLNVGQYEHASRLVTEIGNLLGGWRKSTQPAAEATGSSGG